MIYSRAAKRTSSMRLRTLIHVGACYLAMAVAITVGIAGTAGAFGGIRQVDMRIDPQPPYPTDAAPLPHN
jgi:hypothetical protein